MPVDDERIVFGFFPKRIAPFLFVVLAIAFVAIVRIRLLNVPLERDEGEYAYMGQLILDGIPPYSQAYNMKLPGIYFLYALVMFVFGQTDTGIHLGLLFFNVASIVLMYFIGKSLVNEWVGASASAAYAMLSLSNRVQALWANAEHFVLPFALAGFLALLYYKKKERLPLLILSGALFGIGTLVKQHGGFLGIFGFVFLVALISKRQQGRASTGPNRSSHIFHRGGAESAENRRGKVSIFSALLRVLRLPRFFYRGGSALRTTTTKDSVSFFGVGTRSAVRNLVWFVVGGLMPLVLCLLYIYSSGVFDRFWFWAFTYARAYASQVSFAEVPSIFFSNFIPLYKATAPIWILAGLGCAAVLFSGPLKTHRWFCLSFLAGGIAAISPGYFFRPHYFVLILPSVALLFGLGIELLTQTFERMEGKFLRRAIPVATALIVLLSPIASHADIFFQYSLFSVTKATYGGYPFPEAKTVSRFLEQWSSPEDKIAIIGNEPEMFFYSKRRSATGYLYNYSVIESQPYARSMMKEMIGEIESAAARFLVTMQVDPPWYDESESVSELHHWQRRYSDSCYTLKARYEWTPWQNTPLMVMDEEALQKPSQQLYFMAIYERKRLTSR
ncbi:hypothetical protein D4R75_14180 [bacterium]|nr:MAG: hypothetical protein D4R75_14180 [bacterium]